MKRKVMYYLLLARARVDAEIYSRIPKTKHPLFSKLRILGRALKRNKELQRQFAASMSQCTFFPPKTDEEFANNIDHVRPFIELYLRELEVELHLSELEEKNG